MHIEGIESVMADSVVDSETGVLLLNHAINDYNEFFDPKIDDTIILNQNIKSRLIPAAP